MNKKIIIGLLSFGSLVLSSAVAFADGSKVNINFDPKLEKEFAKNYGEREKSVIADIIKDELQRKFGNSDYRYEIKINNAMPNRPTLFQMGEKPGLSYQSFSVGGADISGSVFDAGGNLIAQTQYDYQSPNIYDTQYYWTWHDAEWAVERFVNKLAKARK